MNMNDPRYLHLSFLVLGAVLYGPGTAMAIVHYLTLWGL